MKVVLFVFFFVFASATAFAKDCGWTIAKQDTELKLSFSHCPEDRFAEKRLVTVRFEYSDSTTQETFTVMDCKRFTYVEGYTYNWKNGQSQGYKASDERERELLLHVNYREVAKRICGK